MKALAWRRHSPGIWDLVGSDDISMYRTSHGWDVEIGGPPLWPIVSTLGGLRTSCGGVRLHASTRADAIRVAEVYLREFLGQVPSLPPFRVISVLEAMAFPPVGVFMLDPFDPESLIVFESGREVLSSV